MRMRASFFVCVVAAGTVFLCESGAAGELLVGSATVSITPDQPVALAGQMHTRISKGVESPVLAVALALEVRNDAGSDHAILVACDLVAIRRGVIDEVRERLKGRLEGFDIGKLILSATHTHTAPVAQEGSYLIPEEGVMAPKEYRAFLVDRIAQAAEQAWQGRKPGKVAYGLGHAVVALNRRAVFSDGTAAMYGKTDQDRFRMIEGYEDHGIEILYFWDAEDRLIATAINVACPAQEVEGLSVINADFWHEVRQSLRAKHGEQLNILGWIGAAGDQSPHLMFRKQAEERMRKLRNLTRLQELARRIVTTWEDVYSVVKADVQTDVVFAHQVKQIELPVRKVTDAEVEEARREIAKLSADPKNHTRVRWHQRAVDRYENPPKEPYTMELHVIRLGDIAIATNDFELFTDFGIQMKARSKAIQTFVIQLAGPGTYLPSERAVRGGGYSAVVQSSTVGPDGGQVLVDETVELINSLWK